VAGDFGPGRVGWDGLTAGGAEGPLWVHLDRTRDRAQRWLREESGLDALAAESLLAEETRPRAEEFGAGEQAGLVVILRGINMNPGAEQDELISIRMWLDVRRVITLRQFRFKAVAALRERAQQGRAPATPGGLLVAVARGLTDGLGGSVANLEEMLDEIEDAMLARDSDEAGWRSQLATIRRQAIGYRRYLVPQREALGALVSGQSAVLTGRERAELRAILDQTTRVTEALEELRDRAAVTQDEMRARHEARIGRTVYLLTIVATVLLPLGFVTGLLGINVGGLPLVESRWGFAVVCVVLVSIAAAEVVWFRKKRWL
jgi:zinc transporter